MAGVRIVPTTGSPCALSRCTSLCPSMPVAPSTSTRGARPEDEVSGAAAVIVHVRVQVRFLPSGEPPPPFPTASKKLLRTGPYQLHVPSE